MAEYAYLAEPATAASDALSPRRAVKPVLFGAVFGGIAAFALMLVLSIVCTAIDVPPGAFVPLSALCAGAGTLLGSMAAAKKARKRGLIVGLAVAALLFVFLLLVSLLVSSGAFSSASLLRLGVMLLAGSLGGSLGNRAPKAKNAAVRFR